MNATIIILRAKTNRLSDLRPVPRLLAAINSAEIGTLQFVED
jgi:hypothetical protein